MPRTQSMMMSAEEARALGDLDRKIDAEPGSLTPEDIQRYRELLTRYVSEMSSQETKNNGQAFCHYSFGVIPP